MISVGIDYSMNSPAVTLFDGVTACCFFVPQKKKQEGLSGLVNSINFNCVAVGSRRSEFSTIYQKYDTNTSFVFGALGMLNPDQCKVFIEGYSYGSKGSSVLNLAENGGILRHHLWKQEFDFEEFAPSKIKKFATGKGNADKFMMYEAFKKETGIDLELHLESSCGSNPISDIVDSYYIAKLGMTTPQVT